MAVTTPNTVCRLLGCSSPPSVGGNIGQRSGGGRSQLVAELPPTPSPWGSRSGTHNQVTQDTGQQPAGHTRPGPLGSQQVDTTLGPGFCFPAELALDHPTAPGRGARGGGDAALWKPGEQPRDGLGAGGRPIAGSRLPRTGQEVRPGLGSQDGLSGKVHTPSPLPHHVRTQVRVRPRGGTVLPTLESDPGHPGERWAGRTYLWAPPPLLTRPGPVLQSQGRERG